MSEKTCLSCRHSTSTLCLEGYEGFPFALIDKCKGGEYEPGTDEGEGWGGLDQNISDC